MKNKIDFVAIFSVTKANPNGDPLNGNRPREDINGYGEISDVALKRKIRNRWQQMGEEIFVQTAENTNDGFKSLKDRVDPFLKEFSKKTDNSQADSNAEKFIHAVCQKWIDVRGFGQVFPFKEDKTKGVSIGVRGPISLFPAFSIDPIDIEDIQITKSVNLKTMPYGEKDASTMGMKTRVDFGLYLTKGSINCQLAEKTGFSDEDAEKFLAALNTLFEGDASSARPEGSMVLERVYCFKHNNKKGQYSTAKVHSSVVVRKKESIVIPHSFDDYEVHCEFLPNLEAKVFNRSVENNPTDTVNKHVSTD